MNAHRSLASFALTVCIVYCLIVLSPAARQRTVRAQATTTLAKDPTDILDAAEKDPCRIKQTAAGGPLRSFGCGVLFYLVTLDMLNPTSETSWYTKCDLNALFCAPGEKQTVVSPPNSKNSLSGANGGTLNLSDTVNKSSLLIRLLRSAKLPVQLADGSDAFTKDQTSSPTFASILFNSQAAAAMKVPNDKTPRSNINNGVAPVFSPGSVIAKLVWGVYPTDDNGKILKTTRVFASAMSYGQQDSWLTGPGNNNGFTLPNAKNSAVTSSNVWTIPPFTKANFGRDCGRALKYSSDLPFAPDCMYFVETTPHGQNAATARAVLDSDSLNGTAIGSGADCTDKPCKVVLLGIHLMVRIKDSDTLRLNGTDPLRIRSPWVFITFWWTGKGDGLCPLHGDCISKPWNNYQMNVTQDFRDDGGPGPIGNVCYNPYLEGFKWHGAATNCVHCHYYAAYKESDGTSLVQIGNQQFGFAAPPSPKRYPSPLGCASNADYPGVSGGVVCTDFVWSVANMVVSPQK
jgi:hypothetical protein